MEIGEIIKDAIVYPFNNIKALIIYMIIGIVKDTSNPVLSFIQNLAVRKEWSKL